MDDFWTERPLVGEAITHAAKNNLFLGAVERIHRRHCISRTRSDSCACARKNVVYRVPFPTSGAVSYSNSHPIRLVDIWNTPLSHLITCNENVYKGFPQNRLRNCNDKLWRTGIETGTRYDVAAMFSCARRLHATYRH